MTPRLSPTCLSVGGVVSRSCSTWIAAFSENGRRSTTVMRIGCAWRFFTVVLNSRRSVLLWPIQDGSFSRRRSGTRVTLTFVVGAEAELDRVARRRELEPRLADIGAVAVDRHLAGQARRLVVVGSSTTGAALTRRAGARLRFESTKLFV